MNRLRPLLNVAALVCSVALAGGYVWYRSGGFSRPPSPRAEPAAPPASINAPEREVLPGSKMGVTTMGVISNRLTSGPQSEDANVLEVPPEILRAAELESAKEANENRQRMVFPGSKADAHLLFHEPPPPAPESAEQRREREAREVELSLEDIRKFRTEIQEQKKRTVLGGTKAPFPGIIPPATGENSPPPKKEKRAYFPGSKSAPTMDAKN